MWLHLRVEPNNTGAEILGEFILFIYFLMQGCLLAPIPAVVSVGKGGIVLLGEATPKESDENPQRVGESERLVGVNLYTTLNTKLALC